MLLFYIRHGDPIYNPSSLTPLGHRQAEAVAHRLSVYGLDRIFCSSSERAKQTAQPTCEILKKEMEILDWANEKYAWQSFAAEDENGKKIWFYSQQKMRVRFVSEEVRVKGKKWYEAEPFSGYALEGAVRDYDAKVDALLAEMGYLHNRETNTYEATGVNKQRIALFAHAGFGTVFLSSLLDIPYPEFCTRFDMGHSGMTVINFGEHTGTVVPAVLQYSNDSHIYAEHLPTRHNNGINI